MVKIAINKSQFLPKTMVILFIILVCPNIYNRT